MNPQPVAAEAVAPAWQGGDGEQVPTGAAALRFMCVSVGLRWGSPCQGWGHDLKGWG